MDRRTFLRRSAGAVAVAALPAWTRTAGAAGAARDRPVAALARVLDGRVVVPGGAGYDAARQLWNTRYDALRPRAIAYCATVADVERVVRWGRANRIHIVPRSGGHSYAGYSSGNGVVVADVSRLHAVTVMPGRALVGAGAKLFPVYAALAQHGVTIPAGSCPTVGVAGLALGGGVGYASRRLGTTADTLRRVRIVTADGQLRLCDATHNPDLFWACRGGGGGNFGIVTDLTFATSPVSTVAVYSIEWPWAQAAQAVKAWQAFAPHAPDALFSVLDLIATGPPSATPHVSSGGQYFGPEADLASLLQPLTSTGSPIRVRTQTLAYIDAMAHWAGCRNVAGCTEGRTAFAAKSDYVDQPLPDAAIAALVAGVASRQSAGRGAVFLDAHGGAINRVAPGATAFVHRNALFSMQYTAEWNGTSAAAGLAWLNAVHAQLRPNVSGFAYQNYVDPQLPNWEHAYYGSNLARLRRVKRTVDPHGFFRFGQSIPS
jgi:FAD/FMN-containing dehydrogenase